MEHKKNREVGSFARRLLAASLALGATSCAEFSPQVADQRPGYGFTPRAASSAEGKGFYDELCGPNSDSKTRNSVDCPVFYGMLPGALDDADAARLRLIKAELNESGAPWLATAVGLPVGAYALYRGIFGHGDVARREIAQLGLAGGAVYSWLGARESRPRQSARLAAIEALSCTMYGTSARYLYERRHIVGPTDSTAPPAPAPASCPTSISAVVPAAERAATGVGIVMDPIIVTVNVAAPAPAPPATLLPGQLRPNADQDGAPSMAGAQGKLRTAAATLRDQLHQLRMAIRVQPEKIQRSGRHGTGCDANGNAGATACQLRGETRPPVITEENIEVAAAKGEVAEAEKLLEEVAPLLTALRTLRDRIDNAPFELRFAVQRIETAGNKAVLATEADVASLRASIGNLKLGSQGLSAVIAEAAVKSSGTSSTPASTSGFQGHSGSTLKNAGLSKEATDAARASREALACPRNLVKDAYLRLQAAIMEARAHLAADVERAKMVRDIGSCEFVPPGLKLVVDPAGPISMESGSTLRLSALGGISMPTVSVTGGTGSKIDELLRRDSDPSPGRQTLSVLLTPAANLPDQDFQLVFRNDDLVEVRAVAVRKPGAKK
ncbi:MAG: hypothetical protein JNL93_02620 [Pelomonas sp.]|nr:hypothetical protein [Roseateles sp.]